MADETLIFQHIPKTGGVTLSHLLLQHFDRSHVFHIRNPQHSRAPVFGESFGPIEEFDALSEEERAGFRCILGHMPFGLHRRIPGKSKYVGVVRDPVERILSQHGQYNRMVRNAEMADSRELTLEEYLKEKPNTLDNHQSRFLLADQYHGSDDESRFDQIKKIFEEHFCVVGVLERFEEMVVVLNREMDWPCVPYQRRNVGRIRSKQTEISSNLLTVMRKKNQLDFRVHEHAEELLDQAIKAYGPGFQSDLARLRRANEKLEKAQNRVPSLVSRGVRRFRRLVGL